MAQISSKTKTAKAIKSDLAKVSNSLVEAFVKKKQFSGFEAHFFSCEIGD